MAVIVIAWQVPTMLPSAWFLILPVIRSLPLLPLMTYLVIGVVAIIMFSWHAANGVTVCIIIIRIVMQADYFN
jgi:hypothetical protein